jgi:hypothetical protein
MQSVSEMNAHELSCAPRRIPCRDGKDVNMTASIPRLAKHEG